MIRLSLIALLLATLVAPDRPDVVVADFEGPSYRPWVAKGEAFGEEPAHGPLPGQMAVEGFEGAGLVNSFVGGDDATGTLTSPPFSIERKHLNFLIGGGKSAGQTCLDLLVDGRVARTATGPNDSPGGSERLDWASWDVANLIGKSAVLRVVDARKGGWGHISVDQIVQSDTPRGDSATARSMAVAKRYLILPVDPKAPTRRVKVAVDGKLAREFDIRLAEGPPGFTAFLDLAPLGGKALEVSATLPIGSKALESITQADEPVDPHAIYREPGRPQFHFTSRRGWLNDPNGLVFFEREYHLFYQHNPYGWEWGNMSWGHAVSPDLVRWKELPTAIEPHAYGDWVFSGSAVVDRANISGFGDGKAPPLVAAYTSTGRGECIVSSLDRGRTWSEFAGNPVIKHEGRDPRLLWHEPTKRWVMALYDEPGGKGRDVAFYSSPDLKAWTYESRIGGFFECPDLFELTVEGKPGESFWVLSAADGEYLLGHFDGKSFTPEPGGKHRTWHGDFYAAQTFSSEPKGRRVQVGWGREITFPGMPFNQQMTVPCELTLRPTGEGVRLFANPVAELETLRGDDEERLGFGFGPGDSGGVALGTPSDLLDIRVEVEFGVAGTFAIELPGAVVSYDVGRRTLSCNGTTAALDPVGGSIKLRVLVDRGSIEVFANDGQVAISRRLGARETTRRLTGRFAGGETRVRSLKVAEMRSSWH